MHTPAAFVGIPLLAGCAIGLWIWSPTQDWLPLCSAGCACLALMAGVAAWLDADLESCGACLLAGGLASGLSLGLRAASQAYAPPILRWFDAQDTSHAVGPVVLEGVLLEDARPTPLGTSLTLQVQSVAGRGADGAGRGLGGVRLSVSGRLAGERVSVWRAGRQVRVTATLRRPAVYLNPGASDERRALARRGIALVGSVKSGALVEVLAPGSLVAEASASCRSWARAELGRLVGRWDARSGGIATAILIGDRTGLSQEDEQRLQEAGTYHVIAISGGNIAILTALLLAVMRIARLPPRAAAGGAIVLLVFYGRITGPAPSIDRAITAAVVYLAGRMLDQRGPAANVLAVAATLAAAAAPTTVFDPGFILSFGATLGILLFVPRWLAWIASGGRTLIWRALHGVSTLLAATIAAEVALAPVGAALFLRMTAAGLVLNFAAIPLMTAVQATAIGALALARVAPDGAVISGYVTHLAASALVESARLVDVLPWLSREVPPPAWWLLGSYYLSLVAGLLHPAWRRATAMLAACAAAAMLVGTTATSRDGRQHAGPVRLVVLDVGQGDASVIVLPTGRALLVDAGGPTYAPLDPVSGAGLAFDIGRRVVGPALRALGVRRLEALIVTHADPDHVGGAPAILRGFRPHAIWEGVPVPPHPGLRALAEAAASAGLEWRTVQAGGVVRIDGVEVRILHPPLPDWERQRVRNEDSVVLDVRYGDVSIVLPGDIGREGEQAVRRHMAQSRLVVLKAPHHGSATSSTPEFLAALRPDAVIFSAGRGSRFGHPAASVVARYRALGVSIFSTPEDGAVFVDTDGRSVDIRGWTGRRVTLR